MQSDKFNRKRILVTIPDGAEIKASVLHHSPERMLNLIPAELVPLAIDILQSAIHTENLVKAYNLKRASVKVKYVEKVREEWKATIATDRAEKCQKEKVKIRKREIQQLDKTGKIFLRTTGMTPAEFNSMIMDKFLNQYLPSLENK